MVRISVRNLIEFLLKKGDIDRRYAGGYERANEGSRIHRRIQKKAGSHYTPEVPLQWEGSYEGIAYLIEGRADGIVKQEEYVLLDEIKTTDAPLESIQQEDYPLHWAQAMCYGFMYCEKEHISSITLQLTYAYTQNEDCKYFQKPMDKKELEEFFYGLLRQYGPWAKKKTAWQITRNKSIASAAFPFDTYRKGQRALAAAVYKAITDKRRIYCQAPTGIGKTISTIFPAVKALGKQKAERIFYLTAKTTTRQTAEDGLKRLMDKGLRLKAVTITAKEKICFQQEVNCIPEYCPYAKGYYDRLKEGLFALLEEDDMTRQKIEAYAKKFMLCPYEFSLDVSLWCDMIICDYNYVFDPVVYLRRFFSEGKSDAVLLIDEAHNLVDRSRDMYSADVEKSVFLDVRKKLDKRHRALKSALNKLNAYFLNLRDICDEPCVRISKKNIDELVLLLYRFVGCCKVYLEENRDDDALEEVLKVYFSARFFIKIAESAYEGYTYVAEKKGNALRVSLLCLDASEILSAILDRMKSAVFFSATLSPLFYYSKMLGAHAEDHKYVLPSPFEQEKLGLFVVGSISTKYQHRQDSAHLLAGYLKTMIQAQKGNYLVYFPSYAYMDMVYDIFTQQYPHILTLLQRPKASEEEKMAFLKQFEENDGKTRLGFCVLGGVYAEGIDLTGDRLIGTAIVGVGLPQINPKQELMREYFENTQKEGYAFAYRYPGMNKVLQAAGRVIRTVQDKGVVILLDERFEKAEYKTLFPAHWSHAQFVHNDGELALGLARFWQD